MTRQAGTAIGVVVFALLVIAGPLGGGRFVLDDPPEQASDPTPAVRIRPAPPAELRVPSLDIRAQVVSVELTADGALLPPQRAKLVGWWSDSAKPGSSKGGTVIAGHTVHTGGGALDAVRNVDVGADAVVRTKEGRVRYRVETVRTYDKSELASNAGKIFDQHRRPRLVLVTCDDWDGQEYRSNVVIFAIPLSAAPLP